MRRTSTTGTGTKRAPSVSMLKLKARVVLQLASHSDMQLLLVFYSNTQTRVLNININYDPTFVITIKLLFPGLVSELKLTRLTMLVQSFNVDSSFKVLCLLLTCASVLKDVFCCQKAKILSF